MTNDPGTDLRSFERCVQGPEWPRVTHRAASIQLVAGNQPWPITASWVILLTVTALLIEAARRHMGAPVAGIAFAWVVWVFTLTCFAITLGKHQRARRRGPYIAIDDASVTFPRSELNFPRPEILGLAFIAVAVGSRSHKSSHHAIALLRRSPETEKTHAVLILTPSLTATMLRASHALADATSIPHLGRFRILVDSKSDALQAVDALIAREVAPNKQRATR